MERTPLPEDRFGQMVEGALSASMQSEAALKQLGLKANGGASRPTLIALPGGRTAVLNAPTTQEAVTALLGCVAVLLQTTRIILVALNDLDSRLRNQAAPTASAGSVERADTPGKPAPGTSGMGPAETQGAETPTGE